MTSMEGHKRSLSGMNVKLRFRRFICMLLAIPAMSVECERVFNSTKELISPERSRLVVDIIEASECLKNWYCKVPPSPRPLAPKKTERISASC
jgi:hypothetical protein